MQLPILRYEGTIHLNATDLDLRHERVIGFDTETRPTFRKGQSHPPALVQIATSRAVYLFQLAQLDFAGILKPILTDDRITKAGIALSRDLIELKQAFPFEPAGFVDLGEIAKKHGFAQTGVRNLAGLVLGGRITKGAQTSNWANPKLTGAQLRYAATDAWVCRELYLKFASLGLLADAKPVAEA